MAEYPCSQAGGVFTGRQAGRYASRQTDSKQYIVKQIGRPADREEGKQTVKQEDKQAGQLVGRQSSRQVGRQEDSQTSRQKGRQ